MISSRFRLRLFMVLLVVLLCAGVVRVSAQMSGLQSQEQSLLYQGVARTFRVYVPDSVNRAKPAPLVFIFHGGGGTGNQAEFTYGMDAVASKYKFIAVYPDGLNRHWNDGRPNANPGVDDVGFVRQMIDVLSAQNRIDKKAVFACGISNGAIFSNHLGLSLSNKIRGIGSVAGDIAAADSITPKSPVSVLLIHGINDSFVPIDGGTVVGPAGGVVLSHDATKRAWQKFDGGAVGNAAVTTIPASGSAIIGNRPVSIPTPATVSTVSTKSGCKVVGVVIKNGGHTWPGHPNPSLFGADGVTPMNVDASEMIGKFFSDIANKK